MLTEKYFTELSRVLAKEGIKTAPVENNRLPILLNDQPIGRVEPSGMMCLAPGDITTPEAAELYHRVAPFSDMVKEYLTELDRAPVLLAEGLDEEFKLLAEFNGAVLAGREMEKGYGMKFVTWDWSCDKTGLYQGHYHMGDYTAAKEDFAARSGLIQKGRQFTDEQLVELYRCMSDTLDNGHELTEAQEKLIERTQKQIESALPDLPERMKQARDMTMEFNQSM